MAFPHKKAGFSTQSDAAFTGLPPLQAGVRALTPISAGAAQVFDTSGLINNANAIAARKQQAQVLRAEKEKADYNTILNGINEYGKAGIERYQPQFDAGKSELYDFAKQNYKAIIDPSLDNGTAQKEFYQKGQSLKNLALQDKNETATIKQYGQDIAQNPDKYTPKTRAQVAQLLSDRKGAIPFDSFQPEQTVTEEQLRKENPAPTQLTTTSENYDKNGKYDPFHLKQTFFYDPNDVAIHEQNINDKLENKGSYTYKDFIQKADANGIDINDEKALERYKNTYAKEQLTKYKAAKTEKEIINPAISYQQREEHFKQQQALRESKTTTPKWTDTHTQEGFTTQNPNIKEGQNETSTPTVITSHKDIKRDFPSDISGALDNTGKPFKPTNAVGMKFTSGRVIFENKGTSKDPNWVAYADGTAKYKVGTSTFEKNIRVPYSTVQGDFEAIGLNSQEIKDKEALFNKNGAAANSGTTTHKVSKLGFKVTK